MKYKKIAAMICVLASLTMTALPIASSAADAAETVQTAVSTAEETDSEAYVKDIMCICAKKAYGAATGNAAENAVCELIDGGPTAVITLTDADGAVLEVYTVDVHSGAGTDQAGEAVDLSAYVTETSEDDYFVPFGCMSDVAVKYHYAQTGVRAAGTTVMIEPGTDSVRIDLNGEDNALLDTYIVALATGIGTDKDGNEVDLSGYKGYVPFEEADFFLPENLIDDAACGFYEEQTGYTAAYADLSTDFVLAETVIEVYDENGTLLAAYTVDSTTGAGQDQDGNAVDLGAYAADHEIEDAAAAEAAYFAPSRDMAVIGKKFYYDLTGKKAATTEVMTDAEADTAEITLFDDDDEVIDTYTVGLGTGIGTDLAGEAVDLSVYSGYRKLTDADLFIDAARMDDAAAGYYAEQNGETPWGTTLEIDYELAEAEITLCMEDGTALSVYTIDPASGIGTDQDGNAVDLGAYAADHDIEDAAAEAAYFAPSRSMSVIAKKYYHDLTGKKAATTEVVTDSEADTAEITLFDDADEVIDTYTVGLGTGIGTDLAGEAVDLSVYSAYREITEADLFIDTVRMRDAAAGYYAEQNGEEPQSTLLAIDYELAEAEITLCAEDDTVLAVYTVNAVTGVGTDQDGNAVDLGAYVADHDIPIPEPDESVYFAPSSDILEYAKKDLAVRTGVTANGAGIETDPNTLTGVIELYDENDAVISTYTIDLVTGRGTDQDGNAVDLPQTGNNAPGAAAAAAGALLMTVFGAFAVTKSDVIRRKK